jgi:hypothetical protein
VSSSDLRVAESDQRFRPELHPSYAFKSAGILG